MEYIDASRQTIPQVGGPRRYDREAICIHTTMGRWSLPWVQGDSYRAGRPASCDYLIARNGNIYQVTRPGRYAYHTGLARWGKYTNVNQAVHQVLIGIEYECLEQNGERITDQQYIAGAALHRALVGYHNIALGAITTHKDIALPRGRKKDPIFWDNNVYNRELVTPSREARDIKFPAVMA
jgi:N-acetyl-anhydromuramyl-L-alanine amidase AmpD